MSPEDFTNSVTCLIADVIGDRLVHGACAEDGIPELTDWQQTGVDTAEFGFADGRRVVVMVRVGGAS